VHVVPGPENGTFYARAMNLGAQGGYLVSCFPLPKFRHDSHLSPFQYFAIGLSLLESRVVLFF